MAEPVAVWEGREAVMVDVPALYQQHWAAITRLAVLLIGERTAAEDIAQEAFVALHNNRGRLRDNGAALAYVRGAVVNQCRSAIQHQQVARRKLATVASRAEREQSHSDSYQVDAEVLNAVRTLPLRMQADRSNATSQGATRDRCHLRLCGRRGCRHHDDHL